MRMPPGGLWPSPAASRRQLVERGSLTLGKRRDRTFDLSQRVTRYSRNAHSNLGHTWSRRTNDPIASVVHDQRRRLGSPSSATLVSLMLMPWRLFPRMMAPVATLSVDPIASSIPSPVLFSTIAPSRTRRINAEYRQSACQERQGCVKFPVGFGRGAVTGASRPRHARGDPAEGRQLTMRPESDRRNWSRADFSEGDSRRGRISGSRCGLGLPPRS
jgi:hypothetical protein